MFTRFFGIEIEFTGITRERAAKVAAEYLGGVSAYIGGIYREYRVTAPNGRVWKFVYDSSIKPQKKKTAELLRLATIIRWSW